MMKEGFKTVGIVSVVLLISVLIGQIVWLNKVREIKLEEFRSTITSTLSETVNKFLIGELIIPDYHFSCGVTNDGQTFTWEGKRKVKISSREMYHEMSMLVFYDHLYQNEYLDLYKMDSVYH